MKKIWIFVILVVIQMFTFNINGSEIENSDDGNEIGTLGFEIDPGEGGGAQFISFMIFSSSGTSGSSFLSDTSFYDFTQANMQGPENSGYMNVGHSFLAIWNYRTESLTVGNYVVNPSEILTIGTWASNNTRPHNGIWYNLEAWKIRNTNDMNDRVSLRENISLQQVSIIGSYLTDSTFDSWDLLGNNCTFFATTVWNRVSTRQVSNGNWPGYPSAVSVSIKSQSVYYTADHINFHGRVGYYDGTNFIYFNDPSIL